LSTIEELLDDFRKRLTVPWRGDEPSAGRVWILWYDKTNERRVRGRLREFQFTAEQAGKGWREFDIAPRFGLTRASSLIDKVVGNIPGRLLVTFPGVHRGGIYRLLDARDGWNYLAVPIPSTDRV